MKKILIFLCLLNGTNALCMQKSLTQEQRAAKYLYLGRIAREKGNLQEALKHYMLGSDLGCNYATIEAGAANHLLRQRTLDDRKKKNLEDEALRLFTLAACDNSSIAQYNLGALHLSKNEYDLAIMWLRKAAIQNNPNAQYNLAVALIDKNKNTSDSEQRNRELLEAKVWLEIAILNGDATACNTLGIVYVEESKVAENAEEQMIGIRIAIKCFEKALELEPSIGKNIKFGEVKGDHVVLIQANKNLGATHEFLSRLEADPWKKEQLIDKSLEYHAQALQRGDLVVAPAAIHRIQPIKEGLRSARIARSLAAKN